MDITAAFEAAFGGSNPSGRTIKKGTSLRGALFDLTRPEGFERAAATPRAPSSARERSAAGANVFVPALPRARRAAFGGEPRKSPAIEARPRPSLRKYRGGGASGRTTETPRLARGFFVRVCFGLGNHGGGSSEKRTFRPRRPRRSGACRDGVRRSCFRVAKEKPALTGPAAGFTSDPRNSGSLRRGRRTRVRARSWPDGNGCGSCRACARP